MKTIYADELFLLNLAINYLILLATAKLCALPLKRFRFGLASALGALYSVIALLLPLLSHPTAKLLLGLAITVIAFGINRRTLKTALAFFAVSAAFGGAVFAASLLSGKPIGDVSYVNPSFKVLFLSFALCYMVLTLVFKRLARRQKRKIVSVRIVHSSVEAVCSALVDTGNELYDPASGKPVLVAEIAAIMPILPFGADIALNNNYYEFIRLMSDFGLNFRLVPYRTITGVTELLPAFQPGKLYIDGKPIRDILIGITQHSLCTDGEYNAIM